MADEEAAGGTEEGGRSPLMSTCRSSSWSWPSRSAWRTAYPSGGCHRRRNGREAPGGEGAGRDRPGAPAVPTQVLVIYEKLEPDLRDPAGTEGLRFLSATVHSGSRPVEVMTAIEHQQARIQDPGPAGHVFRGKTIEQLAPSAHDQLKEEIREKLNAFWGDNAVVEVYFQAFVMQLGGTIMGPGASLQSARMESPVKPCAVFRKDPDRGFPLRGWCSALPPSSPGPMPRPSRALDFVALCTRAQTVAHVRCVERLSYRDPQAKGSTPASALRSSKR